MEKNTQILAIPNQSHLQAKIMVLILLTLTSCHFNFGPQKVDDTATTESTSTAIFDKLTSLLPKKKRPKKNPQSGPPINIGQSPGPGVFMNKFELRNLYLGVHWGQSRTQTLELARKAMLDAQKFGFKAFRVNITGFHASDLDYWSKPESQAQYWQYLDEMMADLNKYQIKIIPVFMLMEWQFPKYAGEGIRDMLLNPASKSNAALFKHTEQFITRYRNNPAILFWELTNELNLSADFDFKDLNQVDPYYIRTAADNYSSDDMIAFLTRFAQFVRQLDSSHWISSGLSIPRPYAQHLRNKPSWSPGGGDGTIDNYEEFKKYFVETNAMAEIMSVHLYNFCYDSECSQRDNNRFGYTGAFNADYLNIIKKASDEAGKPLFIGEFGALNPLLSENSTGPFLQSIATKIVELKIPYSAAWDWEDYRGNPSDTTNRQPLKLDSASMSPESHEELVRFLAQANASLTHQAVPLLHSFQSSTDAWASTQDIQSPALVPSENVPGDFGQALGYQIRGKSGEMYTLRNTSFEPFGKLTMHLKIPKMYQGQFAAVARIQTGDQWHYVNTPWAFAENRGEWLAVSIEKAFAENAGAKWNDIRSYGISIVFDRPYEGPIYIDSVQLDQ